jgi:hypothetical protein
MNLLNASALALTALTLVPIGARPARGQAQQGSAPSRSAIAPCESDSLRRRFDFWVGNWRVTNPAGAEAGRSQVQRIAGGCGLLENWYDARGTEGKSLNTYDPGTGQWRQFWVGQFGAVTDYSRSEWHDRTLTFYAAAAKPGAPQQRLSFTPVDSNTVRQRGELSSDGGRTWTTSYDFLYHRVP